MLEKYNAEKYFLKELPLLALFYNNMKGDTNTIISYDFDIWGEYSVELDFPLPNKKNKNCFNTSNEKMLFY